jgi:signal transduction histidine kinase
MRFGLRGRIILVTVITPIVLGAAALVTVHRNVREHVDGSSIHESLDRSALVFEHMMLARADLLTGGAEVVSRDPRFFSLVTLGVDQRDSRFATTVRGVAKDFYDITRSDLFEVFDRRGQLLASVGSVKSQPDVRKDLVAKAFTGEHALGVRVIDGVQYQLGATPVRSDQRVVGVLLLGSELGERFARELRAQVRCEVTFLAGGAITGTTLAHEGDRNALVKAVADLHPKTGSELDESGVSRVKGHDLTYITAVRRLPDSDPAGLHFYALQQAFDPELTFLQQMQRNLGLLALLAVVVAIVTGLFFSETILRPIQTLVRAAQAMQEGDYAHPVVVESRDELGYLADRFNEMRRREQVYVSGLEESARLKTEFISVASSELRTPISVIWGYRDLLEGGSLGPLQPRQLQALNAISGCLAKLATVAEQATHLAEVNHQRLEIEPKSQSLRPVLERAVGASIAAAPKRRVHVEVRVDADVPSLEVDGELIAEAVSNVVSNGIRETPDDGNVVVRARRDRGFVEVLVSDEGPGIPDDKLSRLFDQGYSVRSPAHRRSSENIVPGEKEMHLGLGLTRAIVEAHAGTISACNRPEGGALVTIRLPEKAPRERSRAA